MLASSFISRREAVLFGKTSISIPVLQRCLTPDGQAFQFPELDNIVSKGMGERLWIEMQTLDQFATGLYARQGMKAQRKLDYNSISPEYFRDEFPCEFAWLTNVESGHFPNNHFCVGGDVDGVAFEAPSLFVDKKWADLVVKLVANGIIRLGLTPGTQLLFGERWDGEMVHRGHIATLLRS
ncbi:MAG: hypothetical protein V4481_04665 [Patescibacteria group bacterium]